MDVIKTSKGKIAKNFRSSRHKLISVFKVFLQIQKNYINCKNILKDLERI